MILLDSLESATEVTDPSTVQAAALGIYRWFLSNGGLLDGSVLRRN